MFFEDLLPNKISGFYISCADADVIFILFFWLSVCYNERCIIKNGVSRVTSKWSEVCTVSLESVKRFRSHLRGQTDVARGVYART
jgi:hypothetical protein